MHYLPMFAVIIPIAFSLAITACFLCGEKIQKVLATAGSLLTFLAVLAMFPAIRDGEKLGTGASHFAFPLPVSFVADALSFYFAVIFSFCFLIAVVYSLGYLTHSRAKTRYFALILFFEASMLGLVLAKSLIGLFLFFELMAVAAYLLIIHEEGETVMFAGAKFLFMTIGAGLAIFFGLVATFYIGGRVDFVPGGYLPGSQLARYALYAFTAGFGVKAGMFPLHIWLPDAHPAAPAPVSALLSGCCIKTGVYGFIRVIHDIYGMGVVRNFSFDRLLLLLAVVTMLSGSAMALQQDHLKRRLAYSSVAQIGYVLLGIALLSERGMFGALFHVLSHALMKSLLFLCAGAIVTQTGKKYVSELRGIGYQMPVTMVCFSLASMAIVGIPPFVAFISKWHLALSSLETGQMPLVFVLILSSFLNTLYYYPIVINGFFAGPKWDGRKTLARDRLSSGMLCTMALLALLCIGLVALRPNWPAIMAGRIAASLFLQ